jgi:hypothetical protein
MAMDDESVLDDASLPLGGKVEFCKYDMTTTMNTSVQSKKGHRKQASTLYLKS